MATLSQSILKPQKDIGCQQLLKGDVSRSGFLRKQPERRTTKMFREIFHQKWPNKYVILSCGCLYIYESELAEKYEKASSLLGYDSVDIEPDMNGLLWAFSVTNDLEDQPKVFRFAATSQDDRTAWMECFSKEIQTSNTALNSKSTPVGSSQTNRDSGYSSSRVNQRDKKKIRESHCIADLDYVLMEADDSNDYQDVYDEILGTETKPNSISPTNQSMNDWSPPRPSPTKTNADVKFNERGTPSKLTEEETELYDDIQPPSTNASCDSPRQLPGLGLAGFMMKKRLPPTPQCDETYEDDDEPPAFQAPPVPQSLKTVINSYKPQTSLVPPLAILPKPELTGVSTETNPLRVPISGKPPLSSRVNDSSSTAVSKNVTPLPPLPWKKPPVSSTTASSKSENSPSTPVGRLKSPSSPNLQSISSEPKVLPPIFNAKVQPTQGARGEKLGPVTLPKPASTNITTVDAPVRKHSREVNGASNGSYLIYQEPDYENRGLVVMCPEVCAISEEECRADSFVRDAFYGTFNNRCVEALSSCDMDGVFLIHNNAGKESSFKTLVVRTHVPTKRIVKYFIIKTKDGFYRIQWSDAKLFTSLASLLRNYQENCLPQASTLSKPYRQVCQL